MKINHLVLASTSSYRSALLDQVGIRHRALAPTIDEETITALTPVELAEARAKAKGLSLSFNGENFLAIAADQVLDFHGFAYGKAETVSEARKRLALFAGHEHVLHSAYVLVSYTKEGITLINNRVVSARLFMRNLSAAEIEAYLRTDEW